MAPGAAKPPAAVTEGITAAWAPDRAKVCKAWPEARARDTAGRLPAVCPDAAAKAFSWAAVVF